MSGHKPYSPEEITEERISIKIDDIIIKLGPDIYPIDGFRFDKKNGVLTIPEMTLQMPEDTDEEHIYGKVADILSNLGTSIYSSGRFMFDKKNGVLIITGMALQMSDDIE